MHVGATCPKCGATRRPSAQYCSHCGSIYSPDASQGTNASSFQHDLNRIAQTKRTFAEQLEPLADTIERAEAATQSKQYLEFQVQRLRDKATSLKGNAFRLLVLGDVNRGKSTILNAILGEEVLPHDAVSCTAIITIIRYGEQKQVELHYNDNTFKVIDIDTFNQTYTLSTDESMRKLEEGKGVFANLKHAIIEYPSPLLKEGVEFIDSPGLNDTKQHDKLSLGYIQSCQAALFVFDASASATKVEREYIENYLQNSGLTVFYLLNRWDTIRSNAFAGKQDTNESKVRTKFRQELMKYISAHLYDRRVFEISARDALLARLSQPGYDWRQSGFPAFMSELSRFLSNDRTIEELQAADTIANDVRQEVDKSIGLRLSTLHVPVLELKKRVKAVEPLFDELANISASYKKHIRDIGHKTATQIGSSFASHFYSLGQNFERDFAERILAIPDVFTQKNKHALEAQIKAEIEQYLRRSFAQWSQHARKTQFEPVFAELTLIAQQHEARYTDVSRRIAMTLGPQPDAPNTSGVHSSDDSIWALHVPEAAEKAVNGSVSRLNPAIWPAIGGAGAVSALVLGVALITGIALPPFVPLIAAMGFRGLMASIHQENRKQLLKTLSQQFSVAIAQMIATERAKIERSIQEWFEAYATQVGIIIEADFKHRKAALDDLVQKKEAGIINERREEQILQMLKRDVEQQYEAIHAHMQYIRSIFTQVVNSTTGS